MYFNKASDIEILLKSFYDLPIKFSLFILSAFQCKANKLLNEWFLLCFRLNRLLLNIVNIIDSKCFNYRLITLFLTLLHPIIFFFLLSNFNRNLFLQRHIEYFATIERHEECWKHYYGAIESTYISNETECCVHLPVIDIFFVWKLYSVV